jgi:putative FmdB family regulatory protein
MTYEYVCTSCGHNWEAEQPISAPALKTCPNCQKETAKRQVSGGAGFILKGGGWYADGYGSKKPEKSGDSKDSKPAETKTTKSDAAKTEPAKTEPAKTETKSADTSTTSSSSSTTTTK